MEKALDQGQYAQGEIAKYEAVYGRNFVSPGGLATAEEFSALLDLKVGMQVLDIGCGLGGSAFYMAEHFGAHVHGIDLSTNMVEIAKERCRAAGLERLVTFEHGDILDFVPTSPYDHVYSRDAFLHIEEKARLFAVIRQALTPGGQLLFTDYCCHAGAKSAEFVAYIQQRHYHLLTVAEYRDLLTAADFVHIVAQDRTAHFLRILEQELADLPSARFDPHTLTELRHSWQAKILRAQQGEQRWGLFQARRM